MTEWTVPIDHKHIEQQDFSSKLGSGDIILFSGKGSFFSSVVRHMQKPSPWTHVGMIFRNPHFKRQAFNTSNCGDCETEFYVLQSTFDRFPLDYTSSPPREKTGPKLTPLSTVLGSYNGYAVAFRYLDYKFKNDENIKRTFELNIWNFLLGHFMKVHGNKTYERNWFELFYSASQNNIQENPSSFFCSELVAQFYIEFGLLPINFEYPNNFNMFSFSSSVKLPLQDPFSMSNEIYFYHRHCDGCDSLIKSGKDCEKEMRQSLTSTTAIKTKKYILLKEK